VLPIITNLIKPDAEVVSYIDKMRQTKYDKNVVEARSSTMSNNPDRVGKTFDSILTEKLCTTEQTLYRSSIVTSYPAGTDVPQRTPADIAKSASCSSRSELTNT
jgi:hypothetical protein